MLLVVKILLVGVFGEKGIGVIEYMCDIIEILGILIEWVIVVVMVNKVFLMVYSYNFVCSFCI